MLAFVPVNAQEFVYRNDIGDVTKIENIYKEKGLKVLWWNLACSTTNTVKYYDKNNQFNVHPKSQWHNLETLIYSPFAPDILALGEYCPEAFDHSTYKKIFDEYPYKARLDKVNDKLNRNGIRIFSKTPFDEQVFNIPAGDLEFGEDCKTYPKNYWDRKALEIEFYHKGKRYLFTSIHLSNPWRAIKKCLGKISTGLVIIGNENNPNYNQAKRLTEYYEEAPQNHIMVGDFNAPKTIVGFESQSYTILKRYFGESVIPTNEYTYIDPSGSYGSFSIDHAFTSSDIKSAGYVIPLAGSDHLPLYIIIE